jgi:hypothetical protein
LEDQRSAVRNYCSGCNQRVVRIALRLNPVENSLKDLSIVASGNEALLQELLACMAAARTQKQQKQQERLEGLPVARTNEDMKVGMEVDTQDGVAEGTMSDYESMEDALGELA